MNPLIPSVALLLCYLLSAWTEFVFDGDVLVLTDDNFDEALATYDSLLIEFYAPWYRRTVMSPDTIYWCLVYILYRSDSCKKLDLEWSQAAISLSSFVGGQNLKLAKIDAIKNTKSSLIHSINTYPTIKHHKGGFFHDYTGGLQHDDIVVWASKKFGPAVTTISSFIDLDRYEREYSQSFILGVFISLESERARRFADIAEANKKLNFAYSEAPEVFAKYGVSVDTAIIIKDNDYDRRNDFVIGDDVDKLTEFILIYSTPLGDYSTHYMHMSTLFI